MIGLILIVIASVSPCDKHERREVPILPGEREAICRYIETPHPHKKRR